VPILVKVQPNRACPVQHVVYYQGRILRPESGVLRKRKNNKGKKDKYQFNCIITTTCSQHTLTISAIFINFTSTGEATNPWGGGVKRKTRRRKEEERSRGAKGVG